MDRTLMHKQTSIPTTTKVWQCLNQRDHKRPYYKLHFKKFTILYFISIYLRQDVSSSEYFTKIKKIYIYSACCLSLVSKEYWCQSASKGSAANTWIKECATFPSLVGCRQLTADGWHDKSVRSLPLLVHPSNDHIPDCGPIIDDTRAYVLYHSVHPSDDHTPDCRFTMTQQERMFFTTLCPSLWWSHSWLPQHKHSPLFPLN